MKKVLLFTFAVAMFAGLSSCTKDYTCTCTYNNGVDNVSESTPFVDAKKSDAEDACATLDATIKIIDSNGTCSLD